MGKAGSTKLTQIITNIPRRKNIQDKVQNDFKQNIPVSRAIKNLKSEGSCTFSHSQAPCVPLSMHEVPPGWTALNPIGLVPLVK